MPRGRRRSPTRVRNRAAGPAATERIETALLRPRTWVPGHGYDIMAWAFAPNFFRGLLRLERGLDVVPDLAERVAVSADGCTYVFQLREGLRWSDGEPLGAADFAETYAAMREQDVPTAHLLYDVEARAVDELTLELRLPEPVAHIPYLFAQLPFFPWPRHKLEELGAEWHAEAKLVGNGPFALADANEERVVFTRNPHWPSVDVQRRRGHDQTPSIPSGRATSGKRGASTSSSSPS